MRFVVLFLKVQLTHNLSISHSAADLSGVPWSIEPFRGFLRFRFSTCGGGTIFIQIVRFYPTTEHLYSILLENILLEKV